MELKSIVIFLYGIPCAGKTTLSKFFNKVYGFREIAVDSILKKLCPNPSKQDFYTHSEFIVNKISKQLHDFSMNYVIEVGCLFSKDSVNSIMAEFADKYEFLIFCLEIDDEMAMKRIVQRNKRVVMGLSDAVVIDDPCLINDFRQHLLKNLPSAVIFTESKNINSVPGELQCLLQQKRV